MSRSGLSFHDEFLVYSGHRFISFVLWGRL